MGNSNEGEQWRNSAEDAAQVTPDSDDQPKETIEDWENSDGPADTGLASYDPKKDQKLHFISMFFLGFIAFLGIVLGAGLVFCNKQVPEFIPVVVGSAVTGIAALFSTK